MYLSRRETDLTKWREAAVPWDDGIKQCRGLMVIKAKAFEKRVRELCPLMEGMRPVQTSGELGDARRDGDRTRVLPVSERTFFYVRTLPNFVDEFVHMFGDKTHKMKAALDILRRGGVAGHVCFDAPVHIPVLADGFLCPKMSLTPSEFLTMRPGWRKAKGRVLIGGLGLGMLAVKVLEKRSVEEVVVCEVNPGTARMFGGPLKERFGKRLTIKVGCVYKYLRRARKPFDVYLMDIWDGYGEAGDDSRFMGLKAEQDGKVWGWGYSGAARTEYRRWH